MSRCVYGDHEIREVRYWCPHCEWYVCWAHLSKGWLSSKLACPKCHTEVKRVD